MPLARVQASAVMFVVGVMAVSTQALTVSVPGTANIFGAGHAIAPAPGGGEGGTLPPGVQLPGGPNVVVTFPSITGQVCGDVRQFAYNGPEGGQEGGGRTDILYALGISGIMKFDATMFLVGVFVGGAEPVDPPPPRLDVTGAAGMLSDYYPGLHQTFFIGDGLTGNGAGVLQNFHAPAGATRLYLGFADAWAFGYRTAAPGWYEDNGGSLSATMTITPEPGMITLVGLGLGLGVRRRGRTG